MKDTSEIILIICVCGGGLYVAKFVADNKNRLPIFHRGYSVTVLLLSSVGIWAGFLANPLGVYISNISFVIIAFFSAVLLLELFTEFIKLTFYPTDPDLVEEPEPEPEPEDYTQKYISQTVSRLNTPPQFLLHLEKIITKYPPKEEYETASCARYINHIFSLLPVGLLEMKQNGTVQIGKLIAAIADKEINKDMEFVKSNLGTELFNEVITIKVDVTIPEKIRTQHQHIVAATGFGKTELLKSMILDDVAAGHSVVVIDSQNDMISELATKIPAEKLILVDPVHCPPALNLFIADTSSELFEYIFSALDSAMTSKQAVAYRFVSQMVVNAGGNIHTMRKILEPGDEWRKYLGGMGETATSFFESEYSSRQFNETRQQILRRLYTVLENEALEKMLGAPDNRINIREAIDSGKVVLISTAKDEMKQTAASLFGRIFIAQVMQAAMGRKGNRKRAYLYIDEFADYAEDSHVLFNLFEQARKYELGLIVAHQYLGQLPPQLTQSLASNTAIKFAGGVSTDDATKLAKQMHTTADFITGQPVGTFAGWVKGYGTLAYGVELGRSANTPSISDLSAIRDAMKEKYGPREAPAGLLFNTSKDINSARGTPEVPEAGEW